MAGLQFPQESGGGVNILLDFVDIRLELCQLLAKESLLVILVDHQQLADIFLLSLKK